MDEVYDPTFDPHLTLQYDLEYIEKMNIWLDIKLISLFLVNTLFLRWDRRSGKKIYSGSFKKEDNSCLTRK